MLLNHSKKPTSLRYKILALSWAGWAFDFYDLMLFAFLQRFIGPDLGFGGLMQTGAPIGIALASLVGGLLLPLFEMSAYWFTYSWLPGYWVGERHFSLIRNTAMGTAFNLARGVQFFTPLIIAWIARYSDLGRGISLAALFALLAGVWIWVFPETKGKVLRG